VRVPGIEVRSVSAELGEWRGDEKAHKDIVGDSLLGETARVDTIQRLNVLV